MARARRIVKWGGLVVCVAICEAWVLSIVRSSGYIARDHSVSLTSGCLCVLVSPNATRFWYSQRRGGPLLWWPYRATWTIPGGFMNRWAHEVVIPMWIPFVLTAVPTVIAWRRDRGPKPGHCACGYNLEGNVSGRCPECGEAV